MTRYPHRIQRRRTKGWRMPNDAIYVGRPTRWGNPFVAHDWRAALRAVVLGHRGDRRGRNEVAVTLYRLWMEGRHRQISPAEIEAANADFIQREVLTVKAAFAPPTLDEVRAELRGRVLACWCPLDHPCHADVLLELANAPLRCEAR